MLRLLPPVVAVGALAVPAARAHYGAVGATLAGVHPVGPRLLAAVDAAVGWALAATGPTPVTGTGVAALLLGTVAVLGLAVAVAATTLALFRAAAAAEARVWVRTLATGEPRRWSTRRWAAVGGAVAAAWAALVVAAVAVVLALA